MIQSIMIILVAALGGVAISIQAQMMGQLDKSIGTIESVFITYGSGGLVIGLIMLAMRGGNLSSISAVEDLYPWNFPPRKMASAGASLWR